jgi:imidazolonepropionase-like amidohydrolase
MRLILVPFFITAFFSLVIAQQSKLAFTNATVVDVEQRKLISNTDVLVVNEKIKEVGVDLNIPSDYTVIDLTGKFLMPGMIDAHVHFFQSGGLYTRPDVIDLRDVKHYDEERDWLYENFEELARRYVRCGITTVFDVGGPYTNFDLRERAEEGNDLPTLKVTGPLISTYQPDAFNIDDAPIIKANSAEEARLLVQDQVPFKPDFIKIWYIHSRRIPADSNYHIVKATIDEAHKHGLKVAVHATQLNTAKLAIKAGCDFLVHSVSEPIDDEFIKLMKGNNISLIPTLIVRAKYNEVLGQSNQLSKEDYLAANPFVLNSVFDLPQLNSKRATIRNFKTRIEKKADFYENEDHVQLANLKKLIDAGINIGVGTDAGNIGTQHASSYYAELRKMKSAGISSWDVIHAATLGAAKVLNLEKTTGTISKGKNADFLILNQDPTQDLPKLNQLTQVIKSGVVLNAAQIIPVTPEVLAQQQLLAYNSGDIEAFLTPYADSIKAYSMDGILMFEGKETMRKRYGSFFEKNPDLHCELVNRMVMGNTVIDQEFVVGVGEKPIEAIAVYTIKDDKIITVHFIRKE